MRTPRFPRTALLAPAAGLALVLLVVASAGNVYAPLGDADPGPLTSFGFAVIRYGADAAGIVAAGSLVFAAFVAPGRRGGTVSAEAYAAVRLAAAVAPVWAVLAAFAVPFSAADAAGLPVGQLLSAPTLMSTVDATEEPKAWLAVLAAAVVTAVVSWFALRWTTVVAAATVALIGLLPPVVAGHASVGAWHDFATNAMLWHVPAAAAWLGSLVALLVCARRPGAVVLRRYRKLSMVCFAVVGVSGAVAGLAAARPSGLLSGYGFLLAVDVAVLGGVAVVMTVARRAKNRWLLVELALLVLATGASVGLTHLVPPSFLSDPATVQETVLGYDLDAPPTAARLLLGWRFDLVFGVLALAASAGYLLAARKLRRRGDRWPAGRTVAWLGGWAAVLVTTSSGLGVYSAGTFSTHMVTHMVLTMLAPVLLALGGPVTLALRALPTAGRDNPPGPREWLVALLHCRVTRIAAHPAVASVVFVGSFFVLYFSGLFGEAMLYHWSHQLMKLHFLVSGYVFAWVAIGVDRTPRPLPHLARLGMVFAVMPFHAFFGVVLMNAQTVVAETFYRYLSLPWAGDLLADQRLGGGIAWVSGELPMLLLVIALLVQWSRSDEREARRIDRNGGADLDAYNAMLAELAGRR